MAKAVRKLCRRILGRDNDKVADALLMKAYGSRGNRGYPDDLFDACRQATQRISDLLKGYRTVLVRVTPTDFGDYALNLVFSDDSELRRAVESEIRESLLKEAEAVIASHGQAAGFNIGICMTSYATAVAVSGSWEDYLDGRGPLYVNPKTGCLIRNPEDN